MTTDLTPVVRKARAYLRTSTALLAAALMLVGAVLVVLQHQSAVSRENFDDNSNVHVVTISNRLVDGRPEQLTAADVGGVRRILTDSRTGADAVVSPRLTLGASLIHDDMPLSIVGLDPAAGGLIGVDTLRADVAYTTTGAAGAMKVDIPVVTSDGADGMSSDTLEHITLERSPTADNDKVTFLEGRTDGATYVTSDTFWRIAETMLRRPRSDIERASAAGELTLVPILSAIYVDVADLQQVRTTAKALEDGGYGLDFALRAFDAIERELWVQRLLGLGLGLVTALAAGGYVVASWRSYLRLSRRDIGILRHWRVEAAQIRSLYVRHLRASLLLPMGLALATVWIGSVGLFGGLDGVPTAALTTALLLALAAILYTLVARRLIGPWVAEDVLTLLRSEREFR